MLVTKSYRNAMHLQSYKTEVLMFMLLALNKLLKNCQIMASIYQSTHSNFILVIDFNNYRSH